MKENDARTKLIIGLTVWSIFCLGLVVYVAIDRENERERAAALSAVIVQMTMMAEPDSDQMEPDVPTLPGPVVIGLREENARLKSHLAVHHADVNNLSEWLRRAELETGRLRDLNDELRSYGGGP